MTPILRLSGVSKTYPIRGSRRTVQAVSDVGFEVAAGETLGIVGESGCGKSTLARMMVGLERPTSGSIVMEDVEITGLSETELRPRRRRMQMVLQDPFSSLNPRMTVGATLDEVLRVHHLAGDRQARRKRVEELLAMVGLGRRLADRLPAELSGGQQQRVGIARALAVEPVVLVLDEAVSALDVSVKAEVMNLLVRLREELGLTYLFISHDLGMVRHISDRIAVMYLGRVVELGRWDEVSDRPLHPYAQALQRAVPVADPDLRPDIESPITGEVPNPADPPPGCAFHPRCPVAETVCRVVRPEPMEVQPHRWVACHVAELQAAHDQVETGSS